MGNQLVYRDCFSSLEFYSNNRKFVAKLTTSIKKYYPVNLKYYYV